LIASTDEIDAPDVVLDINFGYAALPPFCPEEAVVTAKEPLRHPGDRLGTVGEAGATLGQDREREMPAVSPKRAAGVAV
jgi:hypothetical protein